MRRAFVLVELLVTIGIISLLIAAAAVSLTSARRQSRDSNRLSDIAILSQATDAFAEATRGRYPTMTTSTCKDVAALGIAGYLPNPSLIPVDPLPAAMDTAPCSSFTQGYYYIRTVANSGACTSEYGVTAKYQFAFVTGLEGIANAENSTAKLSSTNNGLVGISASANRTPYYLAGPYVGSSCP